MKYKYLITDITDGVIKGTDDEGVARDYALSEDFFVADVERGVMFTAPGEETEGEVAIEAAKDYRNIGEEAN